MENILQAVGNVGFPIAVAAYLLVRIEGKLETLAASIARLAEAVAGERRQEEKN
ncbi:YvrJ family protein [Pelotomaculum terephthalicicum JT]|uniref:YvrJ family protein n=1 Tax=Pelotomaculum terephthalicicum TaxID=206393 RepID=UPI001F04067B|nr:YvrJ family protein [Pelotomaculum terephthalicicum]MCG9968322.1 YvrJ family protein [Pelotomaculum terephthalicicum JT]